MPEVRGRKSEVGRSEDEKVRRSQVRKTDVSLAGQMNVLNHLNDLNHPNDLNLSRLPNETFFIVSSGLNLR
jgi:hypothetical protein